jgi:hypothetical protein
VRAILPTIVSNVALLCAVIAGCGYDFDTPFSQFPAPASDAGDASGGAAGAVDASTGGKAGTAGQGGTGGASGQGGAAGQAGDAGQGGFSGQGGQAGQGGVSGQGGAAGQGGAGGQGGAENCTNNVDDNGDGKIDCEDPDCTAGFTCVPATTGGWSNPGWQRQYVSGNAGTCAGKTPLTVHMALQTSGADGCACGCSAAQGYACSFDVHVYEKDTCAGAGQTHVTSSACYNVSGANSFEGTATLDHGTCAVTPQESFTPPTWLGSADFCEAGAFGGGCGSSDVCVPKAPSSEFKTAACIVRDGNDACPATYPYKAVGYQGYSDTRACGIGTCACGTPGGDTCTVQLKVHSDAACAGVATATKDVNGSCQSLSGPAAVKVAVYGSPGTCPVLGSASVTGSATPTGQMTACCESGN